MNNFWPQGEQLSGLGSDFFSLASASRRGRQSDTQPVDWTDLRDRWEYSHVVRAGLAALRNGCSRRPPASTPTSLSLPAAAEPQRWTDPPGESTSSERSTSPLTVNPAAPSILLALVRDRHAAIIHADSPITANFILKCRLTLSQHSIMMLKV